MLVPAHALICASINFLQQPVHGRGEELYVATPPVPTPAFSLTRAFFQRCLFGA